MNPEDHVSAMNRIHGEGNWVECWHNLHGQKVKETSPGAFKVRHHKDFHRASTVEGEE